MKTRTPNLHGRVIVMSLAEKKTWEHDRDYYIGMGYPKQMAESYAWDHYYAKGRGLGKLSKI